MVSSSCGVLLPKMNQKCCLWISVFMIQNSWSNVRSAQKTWSPKENLIISSTAHLSAVNRWLHRQKIGGLIKIPSNSITFNRKSMQMEGNPWSCGWPHKFGISILGVFLNQQFRLGGFRSQLCGKDRSRDATILSLGSLFQDVIPKLEKMALKFIKGDWSININAFMLNRTTHAKLSQLPTASCLLQRELVKNRLGEARKKVTWLNGSWVGLWSKWILISNKQVPHQAWSQ